MSKFTWDQQGAIRALGETCLYTVYEYPSIHARNGYKLDAPFQRGSIWTLAQKVAWIESLAICLPVPPIFINSTERNEEVDWLVIDGKQRLEKGGHDALTCLLGLLHDAHEAYVGDFIRPMQEWLVLEVPTFRSILKSLKRKFDRVIRVALELPIPTEEQEKAIKYADEEMLAGVMRGELGADESWRGILYAKPLDEYANALSNATSIDGGLAKFLQLYKIYRTHWENLEKGV